MKRICLLAVVIFLLLCATLPFFDFFEWRLGTSPEEFIKEARTQLEEAQKLREEAEGIKREINGVLSRARYIQAVAGTSLLSMYKALKNPFEEGAEPSGLFQFEFPPQRTLEEAARIAAKNAGQNRVLLDALREETERFEGLKAGEMKSTEKISRSIGVARIVFQKAGEKSRDLEQELRKAVDSFANEGKTVADKAAAMAGVLDSLARDLKKSKSRIETDPKKSKELSEIVDLIKERQEIHSSLREFKNGHDYIRNHSGAIIQLAGSIIADVEQGKLNNEMIMAKAIAMGANRAEIDGFAEAWKEAIEKAMDEKERDIMEGGRGTIDDRRGTNDERRITNNE